MSTEDEIVDLKAQIKSISSLYDILVENNTKLRNEKATLQQIVLDFQSRYNESLEEIKRYREALENISCPTSIWDGFNAKMYWDIAREALKEIGDV
jgi:regulator of replication initiation timing